MFYLIFFSWSHKWMRKHEKEEGEKTKRDIFLKFNFLAKWCFLLYVKYHEIERKNIRSVFHSFLFERKSFPSREKGLKEQISAAIELIYFFSTAAFSENVYMSTPRGGHTKRRSNMKLFLRIPWKQGRIHGPRRYAWVIFILKPITSFTRPNPSSVRPISSFIRPDRTWIW